jgi:hypothetical protein
MKKTPSKQRDSSMRPEYDFSNGVRGKYAKRFKEGTNIVVLAPEVAEIFPDSAAVNDALMALVQIAKRQPRSNSSTAPRARPVPARRSR